MSDTLSKVSLVGSISIHTLSFKDKKLLVPEAGHICGFHACKLCHNAPSLLVLNLNPCHYQTT